MAEWGVAIWGRGLDKPASSWLNGWGWGGAEPGLGRGRGCGQYFVKWAWPDPLGLQALRARCVSATWTTAPRTRATMGAAWTASPASPVPVLRDTRARAVRDRWTSAAASPVAMGANVWTWWTNTFAAARLARQVGGAGGRNYIWRGTEGLGIMPLVGHQRCLPLPSSLSPGVNCEVNIDDCASNPCTFGICRDGINRYDCVCQPGFTGGQAAAMERGSL